jgi:hypothetical protein
VPLEVGCISVRAIYAACANLLSRK